MIIGVPKEVKNHEYRVALTPSGAESLKRAGHTVLVETNAGSGSGFGDEEYAKAGAQVVAKHEVAFRDAEMVLKVKEPLHEEYGLLAKGQILFTYLHLAAEKSLTELLIEKQVTSIGYETVQLDDGSLPLLTPMSEIAGRMAVQVGAHYLEKASGGRGVLLAGVPGVLAGKVAIIGGGVVGTNAAQVALGVGAEVTIIDINVDRLRYLSHVLHGKLETLASNYYNISTTVREADFVVGAVLVPGARAPQLVTREMVSAMKRGSVIVDVAVDQGGCCETCAVTSHSDPVFTLDGVVHYCVPNMPGAVPRSSTLALSNATISYALRLARAGFDGAVKQDRALARGVNVYKGNVTCKGVAETFGLEYVPVERLLA